MTAQAVDAGAVVPRPSTTVELALVRLFRQGRPVEEMVPVVLVIIMVVAWVVILGPSILKRRSREGGVNSISHFHRQLRVLEHSAPQPIVAPAYRLRALDGSGSPRVGPNPAGGGPAPVLTVVGATELPRPALAFLGDDRDEATGPTIPDGHDPYRSPRREFGAPGEPRAEGLGAPGWSGESAARQLARRRRRDTLGVLTLVLVSTALIGFIPGASAARIVTAVSAVALAAYVFLLVHLRKRADEHEQKLHYLTPAPAGVDRSREAAQATGYRSGRYAHPSYQAAAAH
jgi:hypothetical protein